jgi:glycosyltransferase involved in cell wall biosynthesis
MIAYTTYFTDGRVKRHAHALAERGDQVDLICLANPEHGAHGNLNVIGLRQRQYRGSSRGNYIRSYLRFFAGSVLEALKRSLKHRYDFAIVCTMPDAAVLCAMPCRLFGTKVVLDIHDTMPELYRDKFGGRRGALGARVLEVEERASTWLAHRVLAVHEPHRARLVDAGVRADKIRVVVNVPDSTIFRPSLNGAAPDSQFTLVFHGTVARRLGLDVAIEALSMLDARGSDVRLLVIGAGDYLPAARALVDRHGLGERVRFLAPVPTEQLPQLLCHASIGLVPNRASSATHLMLPVKMLDYAALGIPIVAARLRTIEHYFDRDSAEFFEPDDATDLARAIERLRADEQRRRALIVNARKVVDRISWDAQRMNLYDAIDSLLGERRGEADADVRVNAS